ncbi:MAG: GIY-YIG nuclease family protein [Elusimicrobiota bacterium]
MSRQYYIYILASQRNGALYIGVSNNLIKRIYENKSDIVKGFTEKYKIHKLVYYEITGNIESAILREKRIKKWNRQWKLDLIVKNNPGWRDLYNELT